MSEGVLAAEGYVNHEWQHTRDERLFSTAQVTAACEANGLENA